jgi:hypothetical protein
LEGGDSDRIRVKQIKEEKGQTLRVRVGCWDLPPSPSLDPTSSSSVKGSGPPSSIVTHQGRRAWYLGATIMSPSREGSMAARSSSVMSTLTGITTAAPFSFRSCSLGRENNEMITVSERGPGL